MVLPLQPSLLPNSSLSFSPAVPDLTVKENESVFCSFSYSVVGTWNVTDSVPDFTLRCIGSPAGYSAGLAILIAVCSAGCSASDAPCTSTSMYVESPFTLRTP
jgi:hypothetical protein